VTSAGTIIRTFLNVKEEPEQENLKEKGFCLPFLAIGGNVSAGDEFAVYSFSLQEFLQIVLLIFLRWSAGEETPPQPGTFYSRSTGKGVFL